MLVAATLCPHPPLLLRELAGAYDSAGEVRADCARAVARLLAADPEVVVVVGGDTTTHEPAADAVADPAPFGGLARGAGGAPGLPLSLGVGERLLAEAGWRGPTRRQAVAFDAAPEECDRIAADLTALAGRVALLVMGDGSARRGTRAPGYHHDSAHEVDAAVVRAVAEGDCHALRALDPAVAAELLIQGRAAWHVLGAAARDSAARPVVRLDRADDPFGVLYVVATWTFAAGSDGPEPRGPGRHG